MHSCCELWREPHLCQVFVSGRLQLQQRVVLPFLVRVGHAWPAHAGAAQAFCHHTQGGQGAEFVRRGVCRVVAHLLSELSLHVGRCGRHPGVCLPSVYGHADGLLFQGAAQMAFAACHAAYGGRHSFALQGRQRACHSADGHCAHTRFGPQLCHLHHCGQPQRHCDVECQTHLLCHVELFGVPHPLRPANPHGRTANAAHAHAMGHGPHPRSGANGHIARRQPCACQQPHVRHGASHRRKALRPFALRRYVAHLQLGHDW